MGTAATSDIYENPDAAETAGTDENSSTTYEEVSDTEHIYMASDDSTGYQEKSEEEYLRTLIRIIIFSMRSAMTEK